jgi:hypothetical protein
VDPTHRVTTWKILLVCVCLYIVSSGQCDPAGASQVASNAHWSGFSVNASRGSIHGAFADWQVPKVTCAAGETSYSLTWVGIGGNRKGSTLYQLGTASDCAKGQPTYFAWVERYGSSNLFASILGSAFINPNWVILGCQGAKLCRGAISVAPGDRIDASVVEHAGSYTRWTIKDTAIKQRGWSHTNIWFSHKGTTSAECIEEAPGPGEAPLSNFGHVVFSTCQASDSAGNLHGVAGGSDPNSWSQTQYSLNRNGTVLAYPSSTSPATVTFGSPTTPSQPVLGTTAWAAAVPGALPIGYGAVEPSVVNATAGADPTGSVQSIVWTGWGKAEAIGHGTAIYVSNPNAPTSQQPALKATAVAFDLGTCGSGPAYKAFEWYFPEEGQSFDPSKAFDVCTGLLFSQETTTTTAPNAGSSCPTTAQLYAAWGKTVWSSSPTANTSFWTSDPASTSGFETPQCSGNWVVAAAIGNGNGEILFSTTGGLHVTTYPEFTQFETQMCSSNPGVPSSWQGGDSLWSCSPQSPSSSGTTGAGNTGVGNTGSANTGTGNTGTSNTGSSGNTGTGNSG